MTDTTTRAARTSMDPRRLPHAYLWGLGLGLVGLTLSFEMGSSTSVNGETTCGSSNLAALIFAFICVLTAVDGTKHYRAQRVQERAATRWMALLVTLALGLLTVVHVLRFLGYVGGMC